jgi:hypothetical protein
VTEPSSGDPRRLPGVPGRRHASASFRAYRELSDDGKVGTPLHIPRKLEMNAASPESFAGVLSDVDRSSEELKGHVIDYLSDTASNPEIRPMRATAFELFAATEGERLLDAGCAWARSPVTSVQWWAPEGRWSPSATPPASSQRLTPGTTAARSPTSWATSPPSTSRTASSTASAPNGCSSTVRASRRPVRPVVEHAPVHRRAHCALARPQRARVVDLIPEQLLE